MLMTYPKNFKLSSPFDLLPIEVMEKIFLLCLPEDNQTSLLPKESHIVQLVISQVSSRWRSIALNTLRLWDNIILSFDWQRAELALRLASLWLHRAESLPITLKVEISIPLDNSLIQDFYHLISPHRFKSLTGSLKLYHLPLQNKSFEVSFAPLNSLSLELPDIWSFDYSAAGQSLDSGNHCQLPNLRFVEISFQGTDIPWKSVLSVIPWHQLSRLALVYVRNVSTMIEIMCQCKALVECSVLMIFHLDENTTTLPTTLPHLRRLSLATPLPVSDLVKVISTFKMPNLTSICITFRRGKVVNSLFGTDFLSVHFDTLFQQIQEFKFVDFFNIIDVEIFLHRMPSLRTLELRGYVSLDFDTAERISTGKLGLHIDTISFEFCRSARRVLNMIEKRQENAKSDTSQNLLPFTHVKLGYPLNMGDEFKERVENLERQHNVRIQMEGFIGDDTTPEEEH